VPLSVSEIRWLFWRLGLATQQRVERMLAWSTSNLAKISFPPVRKYPTVFHIEVGN